MGYGVGELAEAVRNGRLRGVPGFGPKSEERILRGIGAAASDATPRGALHTHTDLTVGIVSLEGMIAAAEARAMSPARSPITRPNLVMQRMTDEKMLAQGPTPVTAFAGSARRDSTPPGRGPGGLCIPAARAAGSVIYATTAPATSSPAIRAS